jgi:hypothetical protein
MFRSFSDGLDLGDNMDPCATSNIVYATANPATLTMAHADCTFEEGFFKGKRWFHDAQDCMNNATKSPWKVPEDQVAQWCTGGTNGPVIDSMPLTFPNGPNPPNPDSGTTAIWLIAGVGVVVLLLLLYI